MSELQQNQVIAIEKGVKQRAKQLLTDLHQKFNKPALTTGMTKVFTKVDENFQDIPPEKVVCQISVEESISQILEPLSDYFDTMATKDTGNTKAKADIVVGSTVLAAGVPVTTLLSLEKEVQDLLTFVSKIPVLDEAYEWNKGANDSLYRSEEVTTQRTAKRPRVIVKYEATKEHPAQTDVISEDQVVGYFKTTNMSGALPIPVRKKLIARVQELLKAIKMAREKANSTKIEKVNLGKSLLDFVFEPIK